MQHPSLEFWGVPRDLLRAHEPFPPFERLLLGTAHVIEVGEPLDSRADEAAVEPLKGICHAGQHTGLEPHVVVEVENELRLRRVEQKLSLLREPLPKQVVQHQRRPTLRLKLDRVRESGERTLIVSHGYLLKIALAEYVDGGTADDVRNTHLPNAAPVFLAPAASRRWRRTALPRHPEGAEAARRMPG